MATPNKTQSVLDQILSAFTPEGSKALRDKENRKRLEALGLTEDQISKALGSEALRKDGDFPAAPSSPFDNVVYPAAAPTSGNPFEALTRGGVSKKLDKAAAPGAPPESDFLNSILGRRKASVPFRPADTSPEIASSAAAPPTQVPAGQTALSRGAPWGAEDSKEFARGLFANSQLAQQELDRYRRYNPKADANDPTLKRLQGAVNSTGSDAQAGLKWATMSPGARQSVLTQEDMSAQRERTKLMTGSFQDEVTGQSFEQRSRKDLLKAQGMPEAQADYDAAQGNLLEADKYYNETGVMRGGAGVGTSTTQAGGVISARDASGNRTLTSPYGTGSVTYLTPEQMKKRPEAVMDGKPASQFFDEAARRQGRTFTVGDATYSPEMSPADRAQKDLDEQKRKAEEERKKGFAASMIKK